MTDHSRQPVRRLLGLMALLALGLTIHSARAQEGRTSEVDPQAQPMTARAEDLFARGKYADARKIFNRIETLAVSTRERGQAVLAQADCYLREGNHWRAFEYYRKAIDNYASFVPYNRVLEIEFQIAEQHFAGVKGSFLLVPVSTREKAIQIYDHIRKAAPHSDFAPQSGLRAAQMSKEEGNYPDAIARLDDLISDYPNHPVGLDGRLELATLLVEYAELADGDGLFIARANLEVQRFLELAPEDHPRRAEAEALSAKSREIEAARLLLLGEFYQRENSRRLPASRRYLRQLVAEYPDTAAAREGAALLAAADELDGGDGVTTDLSAIPALDDDAFPTTEVEPPLPTLQGSSDKHLLPLTDLKGEGDSVPTPAPAGDSAETPN